jgi:hypothetical protein
MFNYGSGGAARGAAAQATSQQVDHHPLLRLDFANLVVFSFSYMAGVSCEESERSDRVRSWFFEGTILGISFPDTMESIQAVMHVSQHVVVAIEPRKPCGVFVNCQCDMCVNEDGEFLLQ